MSNVIPFPTSKPASTPEEEDCVDLFFSGLVEGLTQSQEDKRRTRPSIVPPTAPPRAEVIPFGFTSANLAAVKSTPTPDNVSLFFDGIVQVIDHLIDEKEREASAVASVFSIVAPSDPLDLLTLSLSECLDKIPPGRTLGDFDD